MAADAAVRRLECSSGEEGFGGRGRSGEDSYADTDPDVGC